MVQPSTGSAVDPSLPAAALNGAAASKAVSFVAPAATGTTSDAAEDAKWKCTVCGKANVKTKLRCAGCGTKADVKKEAAAGGHRSGGSLSSPSASATGAAGTSRPSTGETQDTGINDLRDLVQQLQADLQQQCASLEARLDDVFKAAMSDRDNVGRVEEKIEVLEKQVRENARLRQQHQKKAVAWGDSTQALLRQHYEQLQEEHSQFQSEQAELRSELRSAFLETSATRTLKLEEPSPLAATAVTAAALAAASEDAQVLKSLEATVQGHAESLQQLQQGQVEMRQLWSEQEASCAAFAETRQMDQQNAEAQELNAQLARKVEELREMQSDQQLWRAQRDSEQASWRGLMSEQMSLLRASAASSAAPASEASREWDLHGGGGASAGGGPGGGEGEGAALRLLMDVRAGRLKVDGDGTPFPDRRPPSALGRGTAVAQRSGGSPAKCSDRTSAAARGSSCRVRMPRVSSATSSPNLQTTSPASRRQLTPPTGSRGGGEDEQSSCATSGFGGPAGGVGPTASQKAQRAAPTRQRRSCPDQSAGEPPPPPATQQQPIEGPRWRMSESSLAAWQATVADRSGAGRLGGASLVQGGSK